MLVAFLMDDPGTFEKDGVAVVNGAADGIGLAAAKKFAERGMKVCMADIDEGKLATAAKEEVLPLLAGGEADLLTARVDVSSRDELQAFADAVYARFGRVDVLMNNAGIPGGAAPWEDFDGWQKVLAVNLWGPINGVAVFGGRMIAQRTPGTIVNTGSKQGITHPPGFAGYNVSKAAVRAFTENLEHTLRNTDGCRVHAHLLVPGFTFTGLMRPFFKEKPASAWWPEQVVDYMLERIAAGSFYILCPDNEVSAEIDNKRMQWGIDDLIEDRPALSRWHPDWKDEFERFSS